MMKYVLEVRANDEESLMLAIAKGLSEEYGIRATVRKATGSIEIVPLDVKIYAFCVHTGRPDKGVPAVAIGTDSKYRVYMPLEKYCPRCGISLGVGKYCGNCGTKLEYKMKK